MRWHGLDKSLSALGVIERGHGVCLCVSGSVCVRWWGGLHREGKGTSLLAPPEGWNSSRAVPPIWQALVKTIPQLLVTLQIQ